MVGQAQLTVELDRTRPLVGTLRTEGRPEERFSSWLEFLTLIEHWRTTASATDAEHQHDRGSAP
jgi:hypothetical protein